MKRRIIRVLGALAVVAGGWWGAGGVEEPGLGETGAPREEIARWIRGLGDEAFAVREKAREALMEIGVPALPLLREATGSDEPEVRLRAVELVEAIETGVLKREFAALGALADGELSVERGMWLIATIVDPGVEREALAGRLDEMAAAVRRGAGEGRHPADLPAPEAIALLCRVLRDEFGLRGDTETYDHPHNSSLHRVLVRKRGLPILLSEIAVAVARRLELPVVGLPIPGRYMIKYDGQRGRGRDHQPDIIVNPFENWRVMTLDELKRTVPGLDPATDLEASPPRLTILRMMLNLRSDYLEVGDGKRAELVRELQLLLAPREMLLP